MRLSAEGKYFFTRPIRNLLTQGESGVDKIEIAVDRFYQGLDLLSLCFKMRAVSDEGTAAEQLLEKAQEGEDILLLTWTITADFTAVEGTLHLELTGFSESQEELIRFSGGDIYVKAALKEGLSPPPDLMEQALLQMSAGVSDARTAAKTAEEQAELARIYAEQAAAGGGSGSGGGELPFLALTGTAWDYSLADKVIISGDGQLTVTQVSSGAVGIAKVFGEVTLPPNSKKSVDFDYLTAGEGEYYLYTFLYDGDEFCWARTVWG